MRKLLLLSLLLMFIHFKEGSAQCTSNPTVTGNLNPCQNTYEVYNTEAGMTNYSWTVAGGSISTGQSTNSINIYWTSTSSPSVSVSYTNSASCTSSTSMPVVVKPTAVAAISGPTSFCTGTNVTYTVPSGMQNYSWSFPTYMPGNPYPPAYATVVSGMNTNSITVYWTMGTPFPGTPPGANGPWNMSSMSVSYLDPSGNGCLTKGGMSGLITAPPSAATITGTTKICSVTSDIYYYTASNLTMPAINYQWTVTGGTIVSGQGSTSIGVVWSTVGSQQISFGYANATSGCNSNLAIVNVSVNALPAPLSLTGPTTSCAGSTVTYTTDPGKPNYVWAVSSPGIIVSGQGTNTLNVYWKSGGAATVSVNYNVNGCYPPSVPTLNVTVGGATIAGPSMVCPSALGTVYSTEAGKTNYTWTISGGTIASGQGTNSITVNWGATGGSIGVSYTGTNNGCTVSTPVTMNVGVSIVPTPTILGPPSVCTNVPTFFNSNIPFVSYNWSISPTGIIQSPNSSTSMAVPVIFNYNPGNTYWISLSGRDNNGCTSATITKNVLVNTGLSSTLTPSPVCSSSPFTYTPSSFNIGATFSWSRPGVGGIIPSSSSGSGSVNEVLTNTTPQPINATYSYVTYVSGMVNCYQNVVVSVKQSTLTSVITGNASVCANSNGVSYSVINTAGSTYTWTITGGTVVSGGSTNSIIVNWGAAGIGNVRVVETSSSGCPGVAVNKPVVINALPLTSTITGNAGVCANASGQSYSVTSTAGSTYAWTITGGTQASGGNTNSITVNWGAAGTGNVSVTETNSFGCVGTAVNKSISIYGFLATSPIIGNAIVCAYSNGQYSVTSTAGSTYTWMVTGGTIVSGGNTNSIAVNWGAAGYGNVSVIETNSSGCPGVVVNKLVTINPLPSTSAIIGNASVCVNATGQSYSVTNTAGSTYVWTITGGTQASGGNTNSITVNWGAAGTGNVSVIETNSFGCVGTAVNKSISIYILATSAISGNASVCANANGQSYSVTNTVGSTYAWSITGGTIVSGGSTNSITVNWGAAGQGSVNVVETNPSGCVGVLVSKPITINVLPLASITASGPTTFCQGGSVTLSAYGGSSYLWSTGAITQSITVTTSGTYFVTVYNSFGCSITSGLIPVTVNPLPNVSISPEVTTICPGLSTILYASGASTYSWSNGSTAASITVRPLNTTTYTVTGSANGCSASASSTITVKSAYGYVTPSNVDLCTTGGCATLQAGPGSGYHWSFGPYTQSISVCSPGTYTVTYTMNGCSVSASAYVYRSTSTSPAISIQAVDKVKEGTNYLQSMSIDPSLQSGLTSQVIAPTPCQQLAQEAITVEDTRSFSYYPNPASKEVTIILTKVAAEDSPVLWFDMSGHQVKTSTIEKGNKEKTFQIDELDAGVYLVRVKDNGQLRYSKILVNK